MSSVYSDPLDQISNYRAKADGKEFEDKFEFAMRKATKDSKTYAIKRANKEMDEKEGTDFLCGGIRLDPTLHFSGPSKNFMPYVCDSEIPSGVPHTNFKMGVRLANWGKGHYNEFPEPVVVIGLDMEPKDFRIWEDVIMDTISKNGKDIVDKAVLVLDDFEANDKESRAELFETPLVKNENIAERDLEWLRKGGYSEIIKFREELEEGDEKKDGKNETCIYLDGAW